MSRPPELAANDPLPSASDLSLEIPEDVLDELEHDAELWRRLHEIAPALARYYQRPSSARGPLAPPVAKRHRREAEAIVAELRRP